MTVLSTSLVKSLYAAYQNETSVLIGAKAATDKVFQQALDSMLIACTIPKALFLKGDARSNPFRKEISDLFDGFTKLEVGAMPKTTADQYRSSFWIAFETGVPFKRALVNEKSDAKKAANAQPRRETADGADTATTPSLSKTVSATRDNLIKSIDTTISMARTLGITLFAQEVEDLAVASIDGYKPATKRAIKTKAK